MKAKLYARVVAKPINFPKALEVTFFGLDPGDEPTLEVITEEKHSTWEQIQRRFWVDFVYARECEGYFARGQAAFLGNREVEFDRPVPPSAPNYVFDCPRCTKPLTWYVDPESSPNELLVIPHATPEGCGNLVAVLVESGHPLG